jgi:hypothetical protein
MAKKHAVCEEGFTAIVYKGITFSLPWTYSNPDGTPIILTGKSIIFKLIFDDITYTYTETPNAFGSATLITSDLDGEFTVTITKEETATFDVAEGTWALILVTGSEHALIYNHNPEEGLYAVVKVLEV